MFAVFVNAPVVWVEESETESTAPETARVETKSVFVIDVLERSRTLPDIVGVVTAVE